MTGIVVLESSKKKKKLCWRVFNMGGIRVIRSYLDNENNYQHGEGEKMNKKWIYEQCEKDKFL